MVSSLRIVVSGYIAQYPLGGVAWDYLQYAVGLARLGHDVYYIEDTGVWPYNPAEGGVSSSRSVVPDYNVRYLATVMERFGLGERWAYRFAGRTDWIGLSNSRVAELVASADLIVDVSFSLGAPRNYRGHGRLVGVDTDPVFTQIKLVRGQNDFRRIVEAHDVLFSYGECLPGAIPSSGHHWRPLRKPILLSEWKPEEPPRDVFTTVMNWTSMNPLCHGGVSYGQKDDEFQHFMNLPERVAPTIIEIAMGPGKTRKPPMELLRRKGWQVVNAEAVCADLESFRHYVCTSLGEWTVAKNGYVRGQVGWFSGRSACYLAAGRPVVVQDTGFRGILPVGEGILAFKTVEEAAEGLRAVRDSYDKHSAAARHIAEEYFDSKKVLSRLVDAAMTAGS